MDKLTEESSLLQLGENTVMETPALDPFNIALDVSALSK